MTLKEQLTDKSESKFIRNFFCSHQTHKSKTQFKLPLFGVRIKTVSKIDSPIDSLYKLSAITKNRLRRTAQCSSENGSVPADNCSNYQPLKLWLQLCWGCPHVSELEGMQEILVKAKIIRWVLTTRPEFRSKSFRLHQLSKNSWLPYTTTLILLRIENLKTYWLMWLP